ncbi:peptidase, partial [Vibrio parahaemolyticus]|nr:peptidase [Vibrio parahaemolyticus]
KDIKLFQKDGKDMVSFTYENDLGMQKAFTREVVDVMKITAKKGEKANVRPVVEMHVKLGDLEKKIRVNLQDRGRFHYSMILG